MTRPGAATAYSGESAGVLLSLAPSIAVAVDLPALLRVAIDAEQVGAARLHLPSGLADPTGAAGSPGARSSAAGTLPSAAGALSSAAGILAALRAQTRLLLTADPGDPIAELCDRPGAAFAEFVLSPGPPADLVATVARIAAESAASGRIASVSGRGAADLPVLLAAVAAGLHVRVGSADSGATTARSDVALIARAAGLARIAGRPPIGAEAAREMLSPT